MPAIVTNIGVINYSSTSDAEVATWAAASAKQMRDDVAPAWGIPAPQINLVPIGAQPAGIDSWMVVVNDAQQRIGLGYHDFVNFQPTGYVLVEYTKLSGQKPSRVFCHEVLEMSIDPDITKETSLIGDKNYLVEAGDILSFDDGGYLVNDVLVSGFGTPAYFHLETGTVFGIKTNLPGPLPAAAPSNMGTMLCWFENGLLRTEFPAAESPAPIMMTGFNTGSRRFRRMKPRHEWQSTPPFPAGGQPRAQPVPAGAVPSSYPATALSAAGPITIRLEVDIPGLSRG